LACSIAAVIEGHAVPFAAVGRILGPVLELPRAIAHQSVGHDGLPSVRGKHNGEAIQARHAIATVLTKLLQNQVGHFRHCEVRAADGKVRHVLWHQWILQVRRGSRDLRLDLFECLACSNACFVDQQGFRVTRRSLGQRFDPSTNLAADRKTRGHLPDDGRQRRLLSIDQCKLIHPVCSSDHRDFTRMT
jgi:hypothetical protein